MGRRLAVLFPGVAYSCDKPLLHYARRILSEAGYEVILMKYKKSYFEDGRVTEEGTAKAYQKCAKELTDVTMEEYDDILFVGKSIGTLIAFMLGEDYSRGEHAILGIRYVAFTPIKKAFPYMQGQQVLVMAGTNDPVVTVEELKELSNQYKIPLHLYEGGNHSLEVRNHPEQSIAILAKVITLLQEYIR